MTEPYQLRIVVEPNDIDQLGHVNNVTYVRWVQEAATAHWTSAADPADREQLLWIVLRHEIDYKQPGQMGDELIARTWVGAATRLKFERFTEIVRARDGVILAIAKTLWCPINAVTGRPTPVRPEVRKLFSVT